jgi:hypothetical protein
LGALMQRGRFPRQRLILRKCSAPFLAFALLLSDTTVILNRELALQYFLLPT